MDFNSEEKLAIIKMISSMVLADGVVHIGEINEVKKLMNTIDFDSNHIQFAQSIEKEQSSAILQKMTQDKKKELTVILGELAKSDGFVHKKETALLNGILNFMEV